MLPKKNKIEEARKNGSIARMNTLLSAVQHLMAESSNLMDEAGDMMKRQGIMIGKIKQLHNDAMKAFDRYFTEFAIHVGSEKQKMEMFRDLEAFDKAYRKWAGVEAGWKPKNNCNDK